MTIAGKINILFISAALFLACVVTGVTAHREYQVELDQLVNSSLARVLSHPDLQIHIYSRDPGSLNRILEEFLEPPAVFYAIAHGGEGDVLARRDQSNAAINRLPPFQALRGNFSTAEPGLQGLDSNKQAAGTGIWTAMTAPDSLMHLTMPVFSSVNPAERGLREDEFAAAILKPRANSSLVVIGYIHLGIDPGALVSAIGPVVNRVFLACMFFVVLCAVLVVLVTRRITQPLSQLAQLAGDVASGKPVKPVEISASGEIRNIANVLNEVIGGLNHHKKEADLDHQLLSLKADERSSQISRQSEELSTAEEEITRNKRQMRQLAYYDRLTSLPNRHLFTEQLDLLLRLNQRNKQTLALLFLNLDNFKRINDSLGHNAGDLVLREVGKRLSDVLRDSDTVAYHKESGSKIDVSRLGGDEFTVVLNQLEDADSAGAVTRRLIDKLLEPMTIEDNELVVSPSVGIAIAPRDAADVEDLLKAADIAMHHAKASTRHDFLFYKGDMEAVGAEHIKLESDLRKAIERDELELYYQPQVDTVSGSVVGAEALLRWKHHEYGMIPPFKFISLAEEIGLMSELGNWVLVEACRQMSDFRELELKLPRVAINISTFQFGPVFANRVKEVLQQFDLPASALELGLSEGIMMDNQGGTAQCLQELKEMGVYLSIDDFGTTDSPMSYLSRFSLDEIKIDRSFVAGCDENDSAARLVIAIIALAKSLNLNTVAEGVETEEQYRLLRSNGAGVMQGYLFSEPVPAESLKPMLAPWHFMEQVQSITI